MSRLIKQSIMSSARSNRLYGPLPEGWEIRTSSRSVIMSRLIKQSIMSSARSNRLYGPLPEGWEIRTSSRSGITYYLNKYTKKAQWHIPSVAAPFPNGQTLNKEEIRCSHILIKHNESRRPVSWRSESISRTKEEAYEIINNFRQQIMASDVRFEDIAKIYSDCSSAKHYGDLGNFSKGQMQKPFEACAFKLKVGQLSRPIETSSGIHLILRTA